MKDENIFLEKCKKEIRDFISKPESNVKVINFGVAKNSVCYNDYIDYYKDLVEDYISKNDDTIFVYDVKKETQSGKFYIVSILLKRY